MKLRIGTRRSRLALAQAGEIANRLAAAGIESELVSMVTSGDRGAPASTSTAGVKGLFVAEIVRALQAGEIDLAVHSAKDLPSEDPVDVLVAAVPERASPFDVLVSRSDGLPDEAVVGTSSLRRRAQLARARPRMRVHDLRGNVDTRLAKLQAGEVDGLVLAAAGLARLGVSAPRATTLELDEMVPAPGQGALAVQARAGDRATLEAIAVLDHAESRAAFEAEREITSRLGGGCALPLGAYAAVTPEGVRAVAVVVSPDGARVARAEAVADSPGAAAEQVVSRLLTEGAPDILASVQRDGG